LKTHVRCQGVTNLTEHTQISTANKATATASLARVSAMSVQPSYLTPLQEAAATASDGAFQTSPSITFLALIALFNILQY